MLAIIADDQAVNDAVIATLDEDRALAEIWRLIDHLCRDAADPYAPGLVGAMLQLAVNDEEFAGLLEAGDEQARAALARLLVRAAADGDVDPALDPPRTARWLLGLVDALYLMCGGDDFDAPTETAELRRIAARYLAADD
jgi:hypothetical protein